MFRSLLTLTALTLLALPGCGGGDTDPPVSASAGGTASLPASLFVAAAPEGAVALIEAKQEATAGGRVVFEARVGGRVEPFLEGRSVFFVTDPSVPSCDELHGDACKTPWDYCCEPADNLLRHMATVQVVDAEGRPLEASLDHAHGLKPLARVTITGVVEEIDESGAFVVNAESIHVQEG